MPLTLNEIYDRYSVRQFCRLIELKRKLPNGTYETTWNNITDLSAVSILDNNVNNITYSLSNNTYNFGIIEVGNIVFEFSSKNAQYDDENNIYSIFYNFIRHGSLIRVRDGFVDYYTSNPPIKVYTTVFEGFIDGTSTSTKVDDDNINQYLLGVDVLGFLLKSYTVADIGAITSNTLKNVIFNILNRPQFTQFFTVNLANINPLVNFNFDLSQYEGQTQLYSVFQNFSVGQNYFYVKDGIFYYNPVNITNNINVSISKNNLIKVSNYASGINSTYEKIIWQDTNISYTAPNNKYNRSQSIKIDGVLNSTDQQNIVNAIGNITRKPLRSFTVDIPYMPNIRIFDTLLVSLPEIRYSDAFVWDVSRWDQAFFRLPIEADNIPNNVYWRVRKVNHTSDVTKLELEEIVN